MYFCSTHNLQTVSESPRGELTCNERRSAQGDERVGVGLQVLHHVFHQSVHSLNQTTGHHCGLLLNTNAIKLQPASRLFVVFVEYLKIIQTASQ